MVGHLQICLWGIKALRRVPEIQPGRDSGFPKRGSTAQQSTWKWRQNLKIGKKVTSNRQKQYTRLTLHTPVAAKAMSDGPTSSGLTEGEGRGEARHKRTNSTGEAPAIDRPVRGQGESFAYSRFVEESRAADDVAALAKIEVCSADRVLFAAAPTPSPQHPS